MGATIYEVIVKSNAVAEFGKIATAAKAMDTTVRKSTITKGKNTKVVEEAVAPVSKLSRALNFLSNTQTKSNSSTIAGTYITKLFGRANHTAGLSVGSLSLRINTALIPVLFSLVTAMLPVVAGLLAIASAALVAGGAVAGVVGVGIIAWAKKFKKSSGGYGGARRPYSSGEDADFTSELLKGFSDVLGDPKIKHMLDYAVGYTQELFGKTLPDAFKTFLLNVDFDEVKKVMVLFTNWLPEAAKSLAVWGSEILEMAGARSLNMMNKFFKYLAGGLKNTSRWLQKGGFDQLEHVSRQIGEVVSDLMVLGKKALPLVLDAFDSVYPKPIKPAIEALGNFFAWFKDTKYIDETAYRLLGLAAAIMIMDGALKLLALTVSFLAKGAKVVGSVVVFLFATIKGALVLAVSAVVGFFGIILMALTSMFPKMRTYIYNFFSGIINWLRDNLHIPFKERQMLDLETEMERGDMSDLGVFEYMAEMKSRTHVEITMDENASDFITATVADAVPEHTGLFSDQQTVHR